MDFDALSEPLDCRLAEGLSRLASVARQLDWQAGAAAGLSPDPGRFAVLHRESTGGHSPDRRSGHVGIRKATASEATAALERKTLVGKHSDALDGRAIALRATAKGRQAAQAWPTSFKTIVAGLSRVRAGNSTGIRDQNDPTIAGRWLIAPQRCARHVATSART